MIRVVNMVRRKLCRVVSASSFAHGTWLLPQVAREGTSDNDDDVSYGNSEGVIREGDDEDRASETAASASSANDASVVVTRRYIGRGPQRAQSAHTILCCVGRYQ